MQELNIDVIHKLRKASEEEWIASNNTAEIIEGEIILVDIYQDNVYKFTNIKLGQSDGDGGYKKFNDLPYLINSIDESFINSLFE